MASIFKRGKTWWISYYVRDTHVRRSLKTGNKRLAERERQAIEAKLLDPHFEAPRQRNPRVDVFWEDYLTWATDHKREGSVERTTIFWDQLIEFTGATRVGDLAAKDIEAFKRWRKKAGNSEQTINNGLRELKAVFNRGKKLGISSGRNPVDGVEPYPTSQKQPDFHTKEELDRLLEAAAQQRRELEWTVLLGGWAGLRKAEIANCRWEWFDWEGKLLHIPSDKEFSLKSHRGRSVPLNDKLVTALQPHAQESGYLFESGLTNRGKSHYRYSPRKAFNTVRKAASLEWVTPHTLRHTFGTQLGRANVSPLLIKEWMGHQDIKVTMRYAHVQGYSPDINRF